MDVAIIFSILFGIIVVLLVTGRYHRAVAALFGAFLTIILGLQYNLFSGPKILNDAVSFIDVNTVFLVIGVMILVEAVTRTGFFEFIGLSIARSIGGGFRRISIAFVILTIVFSAFLSNITSMIIIGALTISLAKKYHFDPTNIIIYEILMSNVGGLPLLISSIPNLILSGHLQITFVEFLEISLPLTLILSGISLYIILKRTKKEFGIKRPIDVNISPWSVIENRSLFIRAGAVFAVVIVLFVFEDFLSVPIGLIAMGGAISVLVLGGQEPEAIFSTIDWGTIFFLTAFYVVVGGLQASGVIGAMAEGITQILRFEPNFAPALNVWISAVPSSIIDNIPMTLTLIPVMEHVSSLTGISIRILGWAIVFGANLGGNLTPIGSASNIIGLGILRKEGIVIGWSDWIKKVGVFALILIVVATVYVTILGVIL